MVITMTEVSIGYDHTPLNGLASHHVVPGRRLAPIAGQPPAGFGSRPRFAVFAASSTNVSSLISKFPDDIDPAIRPPVEAGVIVLVRPDGYVACVAKTNDVDSVAAYLGAIGVAERLVA